MKLYLIFVLMCINYGHSLVVFTDRDSPKTLVQNTQSNRTYEFGISYTPLCCGGFMESSMSDVKLAGAINAHFLAFRKYGVKYSFSFEELVLEPTSPMDGIQEWKIGIYEHSLEYVHRWPFGWASSFEFGIGYFLGFSIQSYKEDPLYEESTEPKVDFKDSYQTALGMRAGLLADIRFLKYFYAEFNWGFRPRNSPATKEEVSDVVPSIKPMAQILKVSLGFIYRIGL